MSFPVVVNSLRLGDVWIRYDRGNSPLIAKAALIDILTPLFGSDATTMAQLEAMPEKDGSVTLARLQQAGFSVRFDARRLDLQRAAGTAASLRRRHFPRSRAHDGSARSTWSSLSKAAARCLARFPCRFCPTIRCRSRKLRSSIS